MTSPVSERLNRRIERDFLAEGSANQVRAAVSGLDYCERVQAAVVLEARGDRRRLDELIDLAHLDWRDLLCGAGLENDDWPSRLDAALGVEGALAEF